MAGFEDDLMAIKSRLRGESSQLQVIPIFRMGGIGKTTLAKNAYYDPLIVEYFHIRPWVSVSQRYSLQDFLSRLLVFMRQSNAERSGQSNEEIVYQSLKNRRYLIVLDDVCSAETWDDVRHIFPDDKNGSRIMLTTRRLDVAAYPHPCSPLYKMRLMDEDQSWNLLRLEVFAHQDCPPELENIGKEIARSCGGLPHAILVIARFLSAVRKDPAFGGKIAENVNSVIAAKIHPHRAQLGYHIHDLEKVTKEIESIAQQVEQEKKNNNSFRIKDTKQLCDSPAAATSSNLAAIRKDDMIGFEDELWAIKSRLCGESTKLQAIPIVGMGGIGKTILARNAYNDPLIIESFHIRAWVTISEDYSAQEVLSGLLRFLKSPDKKVHEQSSHDESSMAEKVYKSLKGRRYLIVMDDMWSREAWDDVRNIFPDDGNGSRIMLTTRLADVAAYPNSCGPLHEMRPMDEDQSWNLLRQKVFTHQDCPPELEPELEKFGQEIARNCGGLPLAIVVIAGILSTVPINPTSWG